MRDGGRSRRRGAVLATTLLLSVILLIVGMAFLTLLEREVHFQSHSEQQARAYFLARSGIELYFYEVQSAGLSAIPPGTTLLYGLDSTSSFNITQLPTAGYAGTGCLVQGLVRNSGGNAVGLRTLVLPDASDIGTTYEPNF